MDKNGCIIFLLALAGLGVFIISSWLSLSIQQHGQGGGQDKNVANNGSSFVVMNALLYGNMPDLSPYGLKKHYVAYAGDFWPPGTIFFQLKNPQPNEEYARKAARGANNKSYGNLVTVDIEHWPLTPGANTALREKNLKNYRQITAWIRNETPGLRFGYFGFPAVEKQYTLYALHGAPMIRTPTPP